jgi:ABC-2 type transport system ATP-binding protein
MTAAIEFRSVSKRFRNGTLALADATWCIEAGTRACLLGPVGSGKSTAIRLLQGAMEPTGGSVLLLGVQVGSSGYRKVRRKTGIVPQAPGMYPDLTAGEYMALAARLYDVRPERVIKSLGLEEYLHSRMALLSQGFQRRLALAAALVAGPAILLLDEPTGGLDPVAASELRKHLREAMHVKDRTTLLCTHSAAEAEALCDEIVVLRAGRVMTQGTLDDLRRRARPRLRIVARQDPEVVLAEVRDLGQHAELVEGAVQVEVGSPPTDGPALLRKLLDAGVDVYECGPVRAPLESLLHEVSTGPSREEF